MDPIQGANDAITWNVGKYGMVIYSYGNSHGIKAIMQTKGIAEIRNYCIILSHSLNRRYFSYTTFKVGLVFKCDLEQISKEIEYFLAYSITMSPN